MARTAFGFIALPFTLEWNKEMGSVIEQKISRVSGKKSSFKQFQLTNALLSLIVTLIILET